MGAPIYLTFRGKRWKLVFKERMRDFGQCDEPTKRGKEIRIRTGQNEKELLGTFLHEWIHACLWDLDEHVVETIERDLTNALWKLNYRRVSPSDELHPPPIVEPKN